MFIPLIQFKYILTDYDSRSSLIYYDDFYDHVSIYDAFLYSEQSPSTYELSFSMQTVHG